MIGKSNLIIDDTPGITIAELRSKCRKYKLEYDLKLIIIDYLQLMSGSGGRSSDSRQQEISDISRSLKALARELQVPVIALSQLSRAVEQRPEHRPMLSDLRESGAIEQDADVVKMCIRDRSKYRRNCKFCIGHPGPRRVPGVWGRAGHPAWRSGWHPTDSRKGSVPGSGKNLQRMADRRF